MRPYALIDLHCDTLTDCIHHSAPDTDTLNDPARTLSLANLPADVHWAQFFAVYLPDSLRGEEAVRFFNAACADFDRQMQKYSSRAAACRSASDMEMAWAAGKTAAFLSVENGCAFAGDLSRIEKMKRQGVCAVTLTWNGENELGSGNVSERGLTDFGKAAVREMPLTRAISSNPSPGPQPRQKKLPAPNLSSKINRSRPPQLGHGPARRDKNASSMPQAIKISRQRPCAARRALSKRSDSTVLCMMSLLMQKRPAKNENPPRIQF